MLSVVKISRSNFAGGLADGDACTSDWPLSKSVLYKFFGQTYENAVQTVMERLNWNIGPACYPAAFESLGCYLQSEVGCVINVYYNSVKSGAIPEYDRAKNQKAIAVIEKYVTENSGRASGRVAAILYQLYYATVDGSVKTDKILWPIRSATQQQARQIPADIASTDKQLSSFMDYLPWIIGGTVAVVGLSYIIPLMKK